GLLDLGLFERVKGFLGDVNGGHPNVRVERLDERVFELAFPIEAKHLLPHLPHTIHFQCEHVHRTVSIWLCHLPPPLLFCGNRTGGRRGECRFLRCSVTEKGFFSAGPARDRTRLSTSPVVLKEPGRFYPCLVPVTRSSNQGRRESGLGVADGGGAVLGAAPSIVAIVQGAVGIP